MSKKRTPGRSLEEWMELVLKKSIWNFLRKRNSALSMVPH